MIVFEEQLGRLIEVLPPITDAKDNEFSVNYNWGTANVLADYLTLNQKRSFPLIWLEDGEDSHNAYGGTVTRNARIVILNETQAPSEFNPYQYQYDFSLILQPIADNLLIALQNSGISNYKIDSLKTQRITKYSMREVDKTLVYICNAIIIKAEITFNNFSSCLSEIKFNN
jgi:hypothetical protein